jgi:hypothetical protein
MIRIWPGPPIVVASWVGSSATGGMAYRYLIRAQYLEYVIAVLRLRLRLDQMALRWNQRTVR